MKDYFSDVAKNYAAFRPTYPEELYQFIFSHVDHYNLSWDVGCGNGQVALTLSQYFKQVTATDLSQMQIQHAMQAPNIVYKVEHAEQSTLAPHSVNLITIAQALHWFNFDTFYQKVKTTLHPTGTIAAWSYGLTSINTTIDKIVLHFYEKVIGPYWPPERKYIDDGYTNIPFPFKKIASPTFYIERELTAEAFINYLKTWSAVALYKKAHGNDPIEKIAPDLYAAWGNRIQLTRSPIFLLLAHNTTP